MIRSLALALVLCANPLLQEGDGLARKIEEIIPHLSDDSIDVRDRAVQALVDLGAPAVPLLRKRAGELGEETRGRLIEACARIESKNTLAQYLPPLRKVTLEWENRPAKDAFDEIARRTGLLIDSSGAGADGAVTFSFKDAWPLEAIDEVCRRAGLSARTADDDFFGIRRRSPVPRGAPRLVIQNGKPVDYPAAYVRHYRARVTQVSMTRTNTFQVNTSNAQIALDLGFAPDVKPDGMASFKVTEIKDDQGRSLLLQENDRLRGRIRTSMRGRYRGRDMGGYSQYFTFKYPEADAKQISVLRASAVFSYPQEVRTLSFDKPAEAQGKAIELSGLTITLKEFQPKGTGYSMTLVMTGRYQGPRDADGAGDDDEPNNLPFSYEDVELVTEGGEPLRSQGMSGRGDGTTYTWQLDFGGEKASPAKEIRIFCVLRRFNDEAVFELKDIALPK